MLMLSRSPARECSRASRQVTEGLTGLHKPHIPRVRNGGLS